MFGRQEKSTDTTADSVSSPQTPGPTQQPGDKKGRPTPSRKEAEAAARARARAPMDKKGAQQAMRSQRAQQQQKLREAMRSGDERYLPARDQGPVKRYIRNYVDSRLTFSEFLLPVLIVIMGMSYSGNAGAMAIGTDLWMITVVLLLVEISWTLVRLRKAITRDLPDADPRGTTFYTIMRMINLRFLRRPMTQVGIGGKPINRK